MGSNGDAKRVFADRLQDLIKASDKGIRTLAKEIGISTGLLSNYQNGSAEAGIDKLLKIANYFNVTTDFLLGREREPAPDDFIQEIAKRYKLNEKALQFLEALNPPLEMERDEELRILEKNFKVTDAMHRLIPVDDLLTIDETRKYIEITRRINDRKVISTLNEVLTMVDRNGTPYGYHILIYVFNYCHAAYSSVLCRYDHTDYQRLSPDETRKLNLLKLNELLEDMRRMIKENDKDFEEG